VNTFSYAESNSLSVIDATGEMGAGGGGAAGTASYGQPNFGRVKQSCEAPCQHPVTMLYSTRGSGIPRNKTYDWVCLITFATVGKGGGAATTSYMARRAPEFARGVGLSSVAVGRVSAAAAAWVNPYFGLGAAGLGMIEVFDQCDCSKLGQ